MAEHTANGSLRSRVAVVTGAGRVTAATLAARGDHQIEVHAPSGEGPARVGEPRFIRRPR